jgi:hypothetical protein
MKDMECAGLQAKCDAIEDMEAEGTASAMVSMRVEQLTKDLDVRTEKLLKVEQELLALKTDIEAWRPYWNGSEFTVQDLSKQVVFLQQERVAVFINQQNCMRKGNESTGNEDRMTMSKQQTIGMERLARESSVATKTEVLMLQQLTDVWNLRLEVIVRGMEGIPPQWPHFIPDISRTKSRWRTMKEELRMQVGLPCQPRASHRQRNKRYKASAQVESDQDDEDDEYDDDAASDKEDSPVASTDGDPLERCHFQEVKHATKAELKSGSVKQVSKANGAKQQQQQYLASHKAASENRHPIGSNNGGGHYHQQMQRDMHGAPFMILPQQQMLAHGQFHAAKHHQPPFYPPHHYPNWQYSVY